MQSSHTTRSLIMPSYDLDHHRPTSSVHINDLVIQLPFGLSLSSFSLPPPRAPCTVILSLSCHLLPSAIPASALVDDLPGDQSVNYSVLSKKVYRLVQEGKSSCGGNGERAWTSLEELGNAVTTLCIAEYGASLHTIDLTISRPKALLFSRSVSLSVQYTLATSSSSPYPSTGSKDPTSWQRTKNELSIDGMTVDCVLGLNPHERCEKQQIELDVRLVLPETQMNEEGYGFDYKTLGKTAQEVSGSAGWYAVSLPTSFTDSIQSSSTSSTPPFKPLSLSSTILLAISSFISPHPHHGSTHPPAPT
jgi:dihydroneopterin aldolase